MRARGLTLIEMLVVIAILVVLAGILFPLIQKAREHARKATCLANQRQIAMAVQMTMQGDDERLPASATVWDTLALPPKLLRCPAADLDNGYAYNGLLDNLPLRQAGSPSHTILTGDAGDRAISQANVAFDAVDYAPRHSKRVIVSFLDGHVGLYP